MAPKQKLYCVCRQPTCKGIFMIYCNTCTEWFHGKCVGVKETDKLPKTWMCPICSACHNLKDEVKSLKGKVSSAEKNIQDLTQKFNELYTEVATLKQFKATEVQELQGRYDFTAAKITTLEEKFIDLDQKKATEAQDLLAKYLHAESNTEALTQKLNELFSEVATLKQFKATEVQELQGRYDNTAAKITTLQEKDFNPRKATQAQESNPKALPQNFNDSSTEVSAVITVENKKSCVKDLQKSRATSSKTESKVCSPSQFDLEMARYDRKDEDDFKPAPQKKRAKLFKLSSSSRF